MTIIIISDNKGLIADILDLVTGKTAAILKAVEDQSTNVLKQAEAISVVPPTQPTS
jgi:hypothetical protein